MLLLVPYGPRCARNDRPEAVGRLRREAIAWACACVNIDSGIFISMHEIPVLRRNLRRSSGVPIRARIEVHATAVVFPRGGHRRPSAWGPGKGFSRPAAGAGITIHVQLTGKSAAARVVSQSGAPLRVPQRSRPSGEHLQLQVDANTAVVSARARRPLLCANSGRGCGWSVGTRRRDRE